MHTIRLSAKGQMVIPKNLRDELNVKPGCYLTAHVLDGKLIVEPSAKAPWEELRGMFKGSTMLDDLEREHAEEVAKDSRPR